MDAELKTPQQRYYEANKERLNAKKREARKSPEAKAKQAEYDKRYRIQNSAAMKERISDRRRLGLIKTPTRGEAYKIKAREWRQNNKEKIAEYSKSYAKNYAKENREKINAYNRKRRAENKWVNLRNRVSALIHKTLLRGVKNGRKQELLLGYSAVTLASHLESLFTEGMSWDRFKAGEIHIDHIIPISYFRPETYCSTEFRMCWSLRNLRPLWAVDNLKKNASTPENFEELLRILRQEVDAYES